MTTEEFAAWVKQNPERVSRQLRFLLGLTVGLVLLVFGAKMGKARFYILAGPAKTEGRITRYITRESVSPDSRGGAGLPIVRYHPTVEFRFGERLVRFEHWKGFGRPPNVKDPAPVIYNPRDPSEAMIDRSLWNFVPWAPMMVIGLLLAISALKDWPSKRKAALKFGNEFSSEKIAGRNVNSKEGSILDCTE